MHNYAQDLIPKICKVVLHHIQYVTHSPQISLDGAMY